MSESQYVLIHELPEGNRSFALSSSVMRIGRSDECEICLDDRAISRFHAEVSLEQGSVKVKNLGSRNGIIVDGQQVEEAELLPGSLLSIGKSKIRLSLTEDVVLSEAGLPAEGLPEAEILGEIIDAAKPKPILQTILFSSLLLLAVVIAGIVFYLSLTPEGIPKTHIMLKAGQSRLINLKECWNLQAGDGYSKIPSALSMKKGLPFTASFEDPKRKWLLIIEAKDIGSGEIGILNTADQVIHIFEITIQGRVEARSKQLDLSMITDEQKQERAQDLQARGRSLMATDPYQAITYFDSALDHADAMSSRPEIFFSLRKDLEASEKELKEKLKSHWELFQNYRKNDESRNALYELVKIEKLIHNQESIEYQKVLVYKRIYKKIVSEEQEKERSGKGSF